MMVNNLLPGCRLATKKRIAGLILSIPVLLLISGGLWLMLSGVRASRVHFPSASGKILTRTRIQLGDVARLETWFQASQYSYSIEYPFQLIDENDNLLACRVELRGWLRTTSLRRNLATFQCVCERTELHHDRQSACPDWP